MDDLEIREQIARYLANEIDVRELEAWLSAEAWDLEDVLQHVRDLGLEALRLASEYSDGDGTDEDELRERLGVLNRTYWFQHAPKFVWSGTLSSLTRHQARSASPDRSRVGESA